MPERYAAAVGVRLLGIQAQLADHVEGLGGEGLIELNHVDVVERDPRLGEHLARRRDRSRAHDGRIDARDAARDPPQSRRYALSRGALGGHHDHRRGRVVDARGVARRHGAPVLEGGRELGERFEARVGARVLVLRDLDRGAAPLRDGDGDDLGFEAAGGLRGDGAAVALDGQLVLRHAADLEALGDVLGRHAHVVVVDGAAQPHLEAVGEGHVAHARAVEAVPHEQVRRLAHALEPACDHDLGLAGRDRLDGQVDRLQAGGAGAVDRHRRDRVRQACRERRAAGGVARLGRLEHVAHDDLVDVLGRDAGALHGGADGDGAEVGAAHVLERAAQAADGGTSAADDHDI